MPEPFFPGGRRAALTLTFDDARPSQIDVGMEILRRHGVRASFYVTPSAIERRLDGWKRAVDEGHEIGNHTLTHPCSGNFSFSRNNALESYTLEQMERELLGANEVIERMLGFAPRTFAYPCGQTFVGRGEHHRSYVPLIARHFLAGRAAFNETCSCPHVCDLAMLPSIELDRQTFAMMKKAINVAVTEGSWLILFGHEVGTEGSQTVNASVLDELCRYCREIESDLWTAPLAEVAQHIKTHAKGDSPCSA